jgi:ATP-binding cassette subfamily F protein 3
VQEEMEEAHLRLETLDPAGDEYADTLEVMGELQHKLEDLDAFRMRSKVESVLMGLGFSVDDFDRDCDEFSGGWQMRIALAKLLLKEPSLLLLDEPTNHLDLDSLRWFEGYLRGYNGAVILVSHDRAFLDNLTTKTLALALGRLSVYAGNFSYYETEREIRREQAANTLKNQQKQVEQTQKFIDRFRYKATKARQVQSRIKMLEKVEFAEVEGDEEQIAFHFPRPVPSGAVVIELKNISKRYGPLVVFDGLDCRIERGERIAIVGPNGGFSRGPNRPTRARARPDTTPSCRISGSTRRRNSTSRRTRSRPSRRWRWARPARSSARSSGRSSSTATTSSRRSASSRAARKAGWPWRRCSCGPPIC